MTNEELYRQYLSGDAEAFEQLYLQMQGFIASVAKDAAQSFGCSDKETLDELCAEGALELCEHLSTGAYDEDRGKLTTYLHPFLRGNMYRYDKFPNPESGLDYVELSELLEQADVISLHCPLTDETRHMIDTDAIAQMKPGVVLVNTSRGGLVDTEALIEGLKSHKVGAACLDVYEEEGDLFYEDCSEEIVADDTLVRLISMPNVIVTSHQAFLTKEALSNIAATTVDNLLKFERGEPSPDTEVCYHCERKETCRKARDQKCF